MNSAQVWDAAGAGQDANLVPPLGQDGHHLDAQRSRWSGVVTLRPVKDRDQAGHRKADRYLPVD
jgi:hypothetical protein